MKNTTQRLEEGTLDRIRDHGKMGESFNLVLNKVLDEIDDLHDRLDDQEEAIDKLVDEENEPEEA